MNIEVKMGELRVAKMPSNLITFGVGSCLIVTLYDQKLKIGGLAHSTFSGLPQSMEGDQKDTRYVVMAIEEMLSRMKHLGSKKENIESKLIGAANMFPSIESSMGKEIILSAKEKLKKEGIILIGESTGGSKGKSVEFSTASGIVTIKIKF